MLFLCGCVRFRKLKKDFLYKFNLKTSQWYKVIAFRNEEIQKFKQSNGNRYHFKKRAESEKPDE